MKASGISPAKAQHWAIGARREGDASASVTANSDPTMHAIRALPGRAPRRALSLNKAPLPPTLLF